MNLGEVTATFQDAVTTFDTDGGCLEQESGIRWDWMTVVMTPARDLWKAMDAEKSVGPEFWAGAYALSDTMEKGIAVDQDQGVPASDIKELTNRNDVLGSAHDLSDWLDARSIR